MQPLICGTVIQMRMAFFVAGGLHVHTSDIDPSNPHFYVSGQFKNPPVLTDFLNDGGESPIGVALLFNKLS